MEELKIKVETQIRLDAFKPRPYQIPILDAIENKGYRKVLAILPRRAGKDMVSFQLCIRQCLRKVCVVFYIFPTFTQARRVIWDSITNDGKRILDYIPDELVQSKNSSELKIKFLNGSILQLVGSDNFDCFDDTTEILTENGWKLFRDISDYDKVGTRVDGKLEYCKPIKRVEYDYDGELYRINNSSIDMLVTPNHRFYVRSSKGVYKFKEISDPTIIHDAIPSQSDWLGEESMHIPLKKRSISLEDFMALLGIFLSEGSTFRNEKCYRVTISQKKEHVRDKIRSLLNRCGFNITETKNGFNFECKEAFEYFSQFGTQNNRYIPKEIKNLSRHYLKILFDWLIMGDGHTSNYYTSYYSISKKLIDDVQELIIKLGMSGNVYIKKQNNSVIKGRIIEAKNILYEVRVRKSLFKRFSSSKKSYISKEKYTGKVYCVSIPSGVIKVRRNGKECWSGNSLMGTNPQGVVFSEYALQDPRAYQFIRPILNANDGWAVFISTPRGKNHLWTLWNVATNSDDWFAYKMSVLDTGHISLEDIETDRKNGEMSEDLIQQEYFCSFDLGVEGSYYSKYLDSMRLKNQISMVPWESSFKVHTAWDLGVRDATSIIWFQTIGQTVRIIDCYENSKQGLEHYVKVIESKPYSYGKHFAPHDIRVQEWGTGTTRIEKAKQLGISFTIAPEVSLMDGIEAVRSSFSKIWIDEHNCKELIKALENYRQEYDSKKKIYKSQPLHNWASHYADCMRYLCLSLPRTKDGMSAQELEERYRSTVYGNKMSGFFAD